MALCMVLGIGLVGCGGQTKPTEAVKQDSSTPEQTKAPAVEKPKEVTIKYGAWGSEEEHKLQKENLAGIEKVYPGLKIEYQQYSDSPTFWNQLPAQIAAKTAPDIISLSNEGYLEYVEKGAFASIDNEVKEVGLDLSKYADSAKGIWTVNGKLYGIPANVAPAMFFINKDMWDAAGLKEYPKTWDEVKTAAKALTKNGVAGLCINIHEYHLTNYALSFGGGWGNGKTINSDANVKALEFVSDMFKEKIATSPKHTGNGWDGEVFANKKAAMTTGGWWYKGFLKNSGPDIKYAVVPIPKGTVDSCTMISTGIVVLKDAANKVAAVKAAAYLTREEAQQKMMDGVGYNPALKSLAAKYYDSNPEFKAIEAAVPFGHDFGYPADGKKFTDALVKGMEAKILKNDSKSVKDILDEVQKQFNK